MTKEELQKIVRYINDVIKDEVIKGTISIDDTETNNIIEEGFFTEEEFIEHCIVEIDDEFIEQYIESNIKLYRLSQNNKTIAY